MDAAGVSSLLGIAYVAIRGDMSKLPDDFAEAGHFLKSKFSLGALAGGALEVGKAALAAYAPVALLEKGLEKWNENAREGSALAMAFTTAQRRLAAVTEATGNSTGISTSLMKSFALEMDESLATSAAGVMEFQTRLSQFERVQGETFIRATEVAVDWAELYGQTIPEKARVLGMALNDPIRGISLLRRANIQLSESQQQQIKNFVRSNEVIKAQDIILEALEKRYGGAAAKMITPTKALTSELETSLRLLGNIQNRAKPLKLKIEIAFVKTQTGAMERLNEIFGGFLGSSAGDFDRKFHVLGRFLTNATAYGGAGAAIGAAGGAAGGPFAGVTAAGVGAIGVGVGLGRTLVEEMTRYFLGSDALDKTGDALEKKRIEALRRTGQAAYTAARSGLTPDPLDIGRDKMRGIFDPIALVKQIQQAYLDKDSRLLDAASTSNAILGDILNEMRDGAVMTGQGGFDG